MFESTQENILSISIFRYTYVPNISTSKIKGDIVNMTNGHIFPLRILKKSFAWLFKVFFKNLSKNAYKKIKKKSRINVMFVPIPGKILSNEQTVFLFPIVAKIDFIGKWLKPDFPNLN